MKQLRKRIFFAIVTLFLSLSEGWPEIYLTGKSITTQDGLPSNQVQHLVQDKQGFIWMGTSDGLCRFDGYSFVKYPTVGFGKGKINANVGTIYLDEPNNLMWLRTATFNYACYDLQNEKFLDYCKGCNPQKTFQSFITEEKGIWMYESYKGIRHVTCKNGNFECKDYTTENGNLPDVRVKRLMKNKSGGVWVSTDKGLFLIGKEGVLKTIIKDEDILMGNSWNDITFFLTGEGRVFIFNKHGKKTKEITVPKTLFIKENVNGNIVWQDKWVIISQSAVLTMDCHNYAFTKPAELQMPFGIVLDNNEENYWVSDKDGILHLFPKTGSHKTFKLLRDTGYTFSRKRRFSVRMGDDQNFYIATYGNGLFVYYPELDKMDHITADNSSTILASNYLTGIHKDNNGNIWISQEDAGVVLLQKKKQPKIQHLFPEPEQQGEMCNYINRIWKKKDGTICLSTLSRHTFLLNPRTLNFTRTGTVAYDEVQTDSINDSLGRAWIGTWENGLYMAQTDPNRKYNRKSFLTKGATDSRVNALTINLKKQLWIATYNGLYCLDTQKKEINEDSFTHYDVSNGLPSNNITCLLATKDGSLWIGGLGTGAVKCTFDEKGKLTKHIVSTHQGLVSNNVHSITEDKYGNIWVGTDEAISCINPKELQATSYKTGETLLSRLYSNNCAIRLNDGNIIFGTHNGLTIITPTDELMNKQPTKASVTNIDIDGISIYDTERDIDNLRTNGNISLAHDENSLTLYFSDFDYTNLGETLYQYYLEGIDKGWREPSTQHSVDYDNLSPGRYTFHLRTSEDGEETTLSIIIHQPWYNTWWAWMIYLIIFGTAAWYVYRNWRERFRLHQQMKLEKEVAEFRANFFTQVAHEFRTPLAIISGAVDKLGEEGNTQRKPMQTAKRGVRRLTQLVNQLMEFRKINTGNLRLQVEQGEVIGFIRDIYQDFWNAAQQKDQSISFTAFEKKYTMPFDRHFIDTITYNLLSNAIKYTPQGGIITLRLKLEEGMLKMIVEDSGPGIDEGRKAQLFQPFMHGFASQGGMGIGLYTAFRMAQAHKGSLTYEQSKTLGGSLFTLTIPAEESCYEADEYRTVTAIQKTEETERHADNVILEMLPNALNDLEIAIIEDDPDMLEQIKAEVGIYFKVKGYTNGEIGFEAMKQTKPSLLICDVMLPDTNGYDIVKRLKADEEQRNIPVIMLTALDDEQHQIKGYEAGADDYMVKPCNYRILVARAIQLIKWNESHRSQESSSQETDITSITESKILTSQADKRFLERVNAIVEQHISDPDFSIDQMAELMKMGRTKLYGKVKEMTGMSPNKLFMTERMRMAAELLEEGELNISEIGYRVGIPDASYFNKCFKQHFGVAPGKYRKGS